METSRPSLLALLTASNLQHKAYVTVCVADTYAYIVSELKAAASGSCNVAVA